MINQHDLHELGFADGDVVDLVGRDERRAERFRCVAYETPRGCAAAYYPETNVLVPLDSRQRRRDQRDPTSKSVLARIERSRDV